MRHSLHSSFSGGSIIPLSFSPVRRHSAVVALVLSILLYYSVSAQTITVGSGSYSSSLPSGAVGPQNASGAVIVPKVSPGFTLPPQTSDFWSSLIYPFYGDPFSNVMYAHPLNLKAVSTGLKMGQTITPVFAAQDYLFPFQPQLTVGVTGLAAAKATADDYGDWTARARWDDGTRTMTATFGHGLPYVFFTMTGGTATVACISTPTIWHNANGVVGLTIEGRHYGLFAANGSTWSGTLTLQSSLSDKGFLTIALLPDNSEATLEVYRSHAYAFVTDSTVSWNYNDATAAMTATYNYTTALMESSATNVNTTLTALYRHQWLHTSTPLSSYTYPSVAGTMKVAAGNQFTTALTFEGVLPALPDQGIYNRADLLAMVKSVATETLPSGGTNGGTYWNGKAIARFAHLVNIADQLGATTERDYFLAQIKNRLEAWFTAGGTEQYVYNNTWKTLTGYPSEFGADNQINDHNFHAGYAIMGAAIVAQYDSVWASPSHWGGMVDELIRDANNYDRSDVRYPFLRSFDAYAGHSWESGHGDFGDGNNEESSSESMNFSAAVVLWGAATHQRAVRDLGIYLFTTERSAIEQYWWDVDNAVFPSSYAYGALGMVWGGKGVHSTWFGANGDFIHGINVLPVQGGSLYLGRHPEYVSANYTEAVKELNGVAPTWKDILWEYLALSDPATALSQFYADPSYTPEAGESKAHTYHWLGNLKRMGHVDTTVTADVPTYAVMKNTAGERTYTAYNPAADSVIVHFTDGFAMSVPARKMRAVNPSAANMNAPVALALTNTMRGKIPLSVTLTGTKSFDPNGSPLTYAWSIDGKNASLSGDTSYTFTIAGTYHVVLTVTNGALLTAKDSLEIVAVGNGTPYLGAPVVLPGTITAVNYDNGGEGVAYHDVDAKNIGLSFRSAEGVDTEPSSGGGYDVYWMVAGEWIEYTVQVPESGNYDLVPLVSTVPGFGWFRLVVNNVDVSGKRAVTNSGGWQLWKEVPVTNVTLQAGTQILRVEIGTDTPSEKANWLFSLKSIAVKKSSGTGVSENGSLPAQFGLEQNFPNPFNPSTVVRYAVPERSAVQVSVYNTLGQRVAVLVRGVQDAGMHEVNFDGARIVSGVYLVRMEATSQQGAGRRFTATRKMMLVK